MDAGVHVSFQTTFFSEVYFTYGPGPPHGTVSRHGPLTVPPAEPATWVLVPRPSLSAALKGKTCPTHSASSLQDWYHRLLRGGCPRAGVLGTHCEKGEWIYEAGKANFVTYGTSWAQSWGDWSEGIEREWGSQDFLAVVWSPQRFKGAAGPNEEDQEVRETVTPWWRRPTERSASAPPGNAAFTPGGPPMAKVSQGAHVFSQVKHKCLKLTLVTKTLVWTCISL